VVPFALRVELRRGRRTIEEWKTRRLISRQKSPGKEFGCLLARAQSPLRRPGTLASPVLQEGKETNVRLAAGAIDGVVVRPGELFSYHALVKRPSRLRGYRPGLELHDQRESAGIGGGCCQVSNLLYWLGLQAGLRIVERHRHALDLFPDHQRSVPFGCGATVFYNYRDLRMQNPHSQAVRIGLAIRDGFLCGEVRAPADLGLQIHVQELHHRFLKASDGAVWRENQIERTILDRQGKLLCRENVARNRGRVMYPVPEELVESP
jgi:vancomycin resistance protein VanW